MFGNTLEVWIYKANALKTYHDTDEQLFMKHCHVSSVESANQMQIYAHATLSPYQCYLTCSTLAYIIMIILLLCCSEFKSFHVFVHLCLLCHNCRAYGGNYIAAHTHRDIAETKTYNQAKNRMQMAYRNQLTCPLLQNDTSWLPRLLYCVAPDSSFAYWSMSLKRSLHILTQVQ